jgi:hypothetical protein
LKRIFYYKMPSTQSALEVVNTDSPVRVFLARVISYDFDKSVVRINTSNEQGLDTQLITPLLNIGRDGDRITGAGFSAAPEDGSLAVVLRSSTNEWYTLGFVAPYGGPSNKFTSLKQKRNQGDITLSTRDGNAVNVLAGGRVDVRSSSLTGTTYLPNTELIHHTCKNYLLENSAGFLNWGINEKNGTAAALFRVKSRIEGDAPEAILSLGHNSSGNLYEATVSTSPKSRFTINRQGVVRVDSAKDAIVYTGEGNVRVTGRMIYLNSASSGAPPPSKFPGNAPQIAQIEPSDPTPPANFAQFSGIPSSFSPPDQKVPLNTPSGVEDESTLPLA